jgi:hypothetical protein
LVSLVRLRLLWRTSLVNYRPARRFSIYRVERIEVLLAIVHSGTILGKNHPEANFLMAQSGHSLSYVENQMSLTD